MSFCGGPKLYPPNRQCNFREFQVHREVTKVQTLKFRSIKSQHYFLSLNEIKQFQGQELKQKIQTLEELKNFLKK